METCFLLDSPIMKRISILLKTTADESLKDLLKTPYYKIYNLVEQ
jgi:hypothetical protein